MTFDILQDPLETAVQTISVQQLKALWESRPELCVIDVREPHEWNMIRIPGAQLIPKDQIRERITELALPKDQPIYLHCRSGMRSLYAAEQLIAAGYTCVFSVDGGIMDWVQSGYPAETAN